MIYKKSANFPYPLLTNNSLAYKNSIFNLDIELSENSDSYRFIYNYEISSEFIKKLIISEKAILILVIQSKDNKFYKLENAQKFIDIPKSRISLSKKTNIQMSIKLNNDINFNKNYDLNDFYNEFKDEILVAKDSILGFSNVVTFDGSQKKPFELFEKKLNSDLKSSIKIEIGHETIIIHYKHEKLQFNDILQGNMLNNPYIYMGLQKALYTFINSYKSNEDEVVEIHEIDPLEPVNQKLLNLMKNKMIQELSYENVDEVIELISDRIIEKYSDTIRRMINGD